MKEKIIKKERKISVKMVVTIALVAIISGIGTSYAIDSIFDSSDVNYDNTESGLKSTNVQDAVDELFQHATDYTEIKEILNSYLTSDDAGFHNSIYRGKNITSYYTDGSLYNRISGGRKINSETENYKLFEDLYVGDYIVANGINWRIAGFDIYYNKGDPLLTTHHAVIVPDTNLTTSYMNPNDTTGVDTWDSKDANITQGAYVGSYMYNVTLPSVLSTYITPVFGNHVLTYYNQLTIGMDSTLYNRYGRATGATNGWAWKSRKLDLMNENQVFGSIVWSSSGYETGSDNIQFPLFRLKPEFVYKQGGSYWLRNVINLNSFAITSANSFSSIRLANNTTTGVRPYFYID